MEHTDDGRVWVTNPDAADPTAKFRWPAHLVGVNNNLKLAPSQKRRVTEPAPNTTPKTVTRVTEPEKEK